jgi:hypothetical protein
MKRETLMKRLPRGKLGAETIEASAARKTWPRPLEPLLT